jgi:hypothetical protein
MRPARLVAAAVLVALAGGAAYAASRESLAPVTGDGTVTTTSGRHPDQEVVTISSPTTTTPPTSVTPATRGPLDVVTEGMAAWGRFAAEGDLDTVAPWFSAGGPQWHQFEEEAADLAAVPLGGSPYSVVVDEPAIAGDGEEMRVEARVTFVRTREPSQTFEWIIVLRPEGGGWRIWTVEESQSGSSAPSGRVIP